MTKPNWRVWLSNKKKVKVWEACVLSIGLEPKSMKGEDFGWMDDNGTGPYFTRESFPNPEAKKDYQDLVEILSENLFDREYFSAGDIILGKGAAFHSVRLDEFASWATSKAKWLDLPPELAGLVLDKTNGDSKAPREVPITRVISQQKPSRDTDLTTEISNAKNTAQDPNSNASVWTSLRDMALNGEGLFTGVADNKGLHYAKSSDNSAAIFTKKALSKRLNRRKSKGVT